MKRLILMALFFIGSTSYAQDFWHIDLGVDMRGSLFMESFSPSIGGGYTHKMPYGPMLLDVAIAYKASEEVRTELNLGVRLPRRFSLFTGASQTFNLAYDYATIRGIDHVTLRKGFDSGHFISAEWLKSNHGLSSDKSTYETVTLGVGITF